MPYLSTNFLRRQKLTRSIGEFGGINTRPELTPKDNVQAHMNTMSSMGGGEIYLGPYDFLIQSEATDATDAATANFWSVPENVTLVGVPNRTKIYKTTKYAEGVGNAVVNVKSLGPVVSLTGNGSSIVGCTVYLDLLSNSSPAGGGRGADFRTDGSGGIGLYVPGVGTLNGISRENTCVIYAGGDYTRRKVQNCTIGLPSIEAQDQSFIGVYIDDTGETKTIVANNYFMNWCGSIYSAGIYLLDGAKSAGIVGNIANYGDSFLVSVLAADASHSAITGNVGSATNR